MVAKLCVSYQTRLPTSYMVTTMYNAFYALCKYYKCLLRTNS